MKPSKREGHRRQIMSRTSRIPLLVFLLLPAFLLVLAACGESGGGLDPIVPAGGTTIPASEYISAVAMDDVAGTYVDEAMPEGTSDGPVILGAREYVQGSSAVLQVSVDPGATQLLISADNTVNGYWTIDLMAAAKTATSIQDLSLPGAESTLAKIAVTRGPEAAAAALANSWIITITPTGTPGRTSFRLLVASRDANGVSKASRHTVVQNATAVGSDALQVSLNWIHPIDMDLHVVTPSGEDIYWQHKSGTEGGTLDLDSNAACSIDGVNNENITWLSSTPAAGQYIVRLDLWAACAQEGPFPYLITVTVHGETTLYQGEMSATEADTGGEGAGRFITSINVGG